MRQRKHLTLAVMIALGLPDAATLSRAEEPASLGNRHPLLEQLNRETRALYDDVRQSVVRAQLPPQQWLSNYAAKQNPLNKYQNLSPQMKKEIERQEKQGPVPEALVRGHTPDAATRSTTDADGPRDGGTYIVVPPPRQPEAPADPIAGGKLQADFKPAAAAFVPNNIGVVLDDQGHVLVPLYVESETGTQPSIRLAGTDGAAVDTTFLGSDRQTNLSVLKVSKPLGKPVRLGREKPSDGSLVMTLSPADASGRLVVWNGNGNQENGVIFTADGEMAGVARFGQFLTGSSCRLIADQIIRHGSVKRATLGVIISEIAPDDPARQNSPALGMRTAMRIDQVIPGSAADKAGLKVGDFVLALAGDAVSDIPSFAAAIAARSGQTELQVLRGAELMKVTVELQPK